MLIAMQAANLYGDDHFLLCGGEFGEKLFLFLPLQRWLRRFGHGLLQLSAERHLVIRSAALQMPVVMCHCYAVHRLQLPLVGYHMCVGAHSLLMHRTRACLS